MVVVAPPIEDDESANPNSRDPIDPHCLTCKHLMTKHDKIKGCRHEGWVHKCNCKQFVFDKVLFDKQIQEDLDDWKEDYGDSPEEKQVVEFMKPLVEKHIREYESEAIEKSKPNSGDTHE